MTTESDFIAALDANPDSHMIRLAFADFLEEQDPPDPRAAGYRALGVNQRVPSHGDPVPSCRRGDGWSFWGSATMNEPHHLPWSWRDLLLGSRSREGAWRPTRREIEDAAALAFAQLPADRRAALLAPTPAEARA